MVNSQSRIRYAGAAWLVLVAMVLAASLSFGASVPLVGLVLVVGVAPIFVARVIGFGGPPQSVADVLHDMDTPGDRR